jgi:hypothetical protein
VSVPYRYIKGAAAGRDETCVLCGSRRTDLVVDHCHPHGYSRGLLCGSCNSRLAALDAGTATPTPKETFYLGNCPECRKTESPDSPHALALRIGSVALAVSSALDLSPRQAAALALALAEDEGREAPERKAPGREPESERREHLSLKALAGESLTAAVRELRKAGRTENEIKTIVPTLPGHEGVKPDSLKKAIARTR